ncbi:Transcription factor [Penicillium cf. griseofulvum]|uniref:Transcription factor n=1 Tax=Penicillium cf. griseofulvum TaxID=2972120 RepID=A0A9W9T670_9EURO|nr:Transcription factor [Penicillium cf. griseofulvum]KAJ5422409.1 Transcription factor [Penicillium cf. griseofulvum]KAJ5428591.1 Transcription factor [Penicillium cf. griseofulvum]
MSNIPFPSWNDQQSLFKLSCADADTCNQLFGVDNPIPHLQPGESEVGTKKMAIPRLADGAESAFTSPGRFHRRHVRRACESCRQRKTKCTGDKSGCRNCREAGIICCYTDGKREKSKRQLASLSAKVQAYEDVISKLSNRLGVSDEQLVNIALTAESAPDLAFNPETCLAAAGERRISWHAGSEPPPSRASSVSPLESGDQTEEDFNRDETARATGFIGKSSEITWLQRLSKEVNSECEAWPATIPNIDEDNGLPSPTLTPRLENPSEPWVVASNYYLDDLDIPTADQSDMYGVPSREMAGKMLNAYLTSVHPSFPIIGVSTFVPQFQVFFSQPSLKPGNKWLAILNLIFAIAAKYGHLTNSDWNEEDDDHQMYFSRARALSLEDQILHHPDLQQLQVEGLTSFYLIASGHINRAWKLSGSAVRGALALGLHLRNVGASISDTSKEIRYRVWWSLYTLDHLLTIMTGRPSCIIDSSCTTPMPVPFDESDFQKDEVARLIGTAVLRTSSGSERIPANNNADDLESTADSDSNDLPAEGETKMSRVEYLKSLPPCTSLYFLQLASLTSVSKRMTVKLYSPEALQSPWASTEFTIKSLMLEIDSWFMNLPAAYDFTSTQTSQCPIGQRMGLAFLFYSTKIGITRPCLCRLNQSPSDEDKTYEFCNKTAAECVEAACHMLTLFPDTPDAVLLYRMSPWWCTLHYLMQAVTVLLLELAFRAQHVPEKATMVSKAAKKALDWLSTLSKTNMASERAWKLCDGFLRRLAPHIGINVNDFPTTEESDSLFDVPDTTDTAAVPEEPAADDVAFDPSATMPAVVAVDAISAELDSIACSPMNQANPTPLGMQEPYGLEAPDLLDQFIKQEKDLSGRSSYDECFPYDPATGQLTGSFFPSGPNMELDMGYFWGDPVC